VESAKIWKTRDQPKPGSLFGKMRDPGNQVGFDKVSVEAMYKFITITEAENQENLLNFEHLPHTFYLVFDQLNNSSLVFATS